MGSDSSPHKRNLRLFMAYRNIVSFLAGGVTASLVAYFTVISKDAPHTLSFPLLPSSNECQISFGRFHGHEYITESGGTVGKPKCLVESKFLKLQQHQVKFPGSKDVISDWLWIDYHDNINVLVEAPRKSNTSGKRQFLVFEQTKYGLEGRTSLAVVGGLVEPGEEPERSARREVEEEMKMQCEDFHFLGRFRTDVNRGVGWSLSYLALNCRSYNAADGENEIKDDEQVGAKDMENQRLRRFDQEELRQAVTTGKFLEAKWSATVALSLLHPAVA